MRKITALIVTFIYILSSPGLGYSLRPAASAVNHKDTNVDGPSNNTLLDAHTKPFASEKKSKTIAIISAALVAGQVLMHASTEAAPLAAIGQVSDEKAGIDTIHRLIKQLGDDEQFIIAKAVEKLEKMWPDSHDHLIKAISGENAQVRGRAAHILEKKGALPLGIKLNRYRMDLEESNEFFRIVALLEIGNMGENAKTILPLVAAQLKLNSQRLRAYAVKAMGDIGAASIGYMDEILKVLKDKENNNDTRTAAAEASIKISREAATVKVLVDTLAGEPDNTTLCVGICGLLGSIGNDAEPALAVLQAMTKPPHSKDIIRAARQSIKDIKRGAYRKKYPANPKSSSSGVSTIEKVRELNVAAAETSGSLGKIPKIELIVSRSVASAA
jgi:HEAT repeat protein